MPWQRSQPIPVPNSNQVISCPRAWNQPQDGLHAPRSTHRTPRTSTRQKRTLLQPPPLCLRLYQPQHPHPWNSTRYHDPGHHPLRRYRYRYRRTPSPHRGCPCQMMTHRRRRCHSHLTPPPMRKSDPRPRLCSAQGLRAHRQPPARPRWKSQQQPVRRQPPAGSKPELPPTWRHFHRRLTAAASSRCSLRNEPVRERLARPLYHG